ncbi:MAG TPA: MerR family DNA-binding transcriptional regulator, partial [Candidatus Eisenbacteria bacterium]|nr:MerR family DNA-binding transcriptional regulator [Candidatus Eisenbacteria bacterium]
MLNDLPKDKNIVPIRQASQILGVSIDTIRRWDKDGILHSQRPNGKDRYFSIEELEKVKLSHPLSISDVAHRLNMSQSTLRRLEKKGLIAPERDQNGERIYTQKTLENFLNSSYFLRKNEVQEKILEPLKQIHSVNSGQTGQVVAPEENTANLPQQTVQENQVDDVTNVEKELQEVALSNNRLMMLLGSNLVKNNKNIGGIVSIAKFIVNSSVVLAAAAIVVIAILVFLFLKFPNETAKFFATGPAEPKFVSQQQEGVSVLGAETGPEPSLAQNVASTLLRPFAGVSLQIVKVIRPQVYTQVNNQVFPPTATTVMQVTNQGDVVTNGDIIIPDGNTIRIENKDVIQNLNAEFVRSKAPGTGQGDLAVFGANGTIDGLQVGTSNIITNSITTNLLSSNSVTTINVSNGAITAAKIADESITTTQILNGTLLNEDISDTAGITDSKLDQITSTGKVAGSALQLASNGGLTNNSGISLSTSCSSNQTLVWDGDSWECGTTSSGDITGVTAGNGLTGGGTTGDVSVAVLLPTSGTSANTTSNSGLEVGTTGVSLLRGCNDTQVLTWNSATSEWQCADQTGGGGGGISTIKEANVNVVTSATSINFGGSDFDVTNAGAGQGNIALATTAVSAGSYGSSGATVPTFTVDANGRLTAAGSYVISGLTNSNLSGSAGITNANLANS